MYKKIYIYIYIYICLFIYLWVYWIICGPVTSCSDLFPVRGALRSSYLGGSAAAPPPWQVAPSPCVQCLCFRKAHAGASFACLVPLLLSFSTCALDLQVDSCINCLFDSGNGRQIVCVWRPYDVIQLRWTFAGILVRLNPVCLPATYSSLLFLFAFAWNLWFPFQYCTKRWQFAHLPWALSSSTWLLYLRTLVAFTIDLEAYLTFVCGFPGN